MLLTHDLSYYTPQKIEGLKARKQRYIARQLKKFSGKISGIVNSFREQITLTFF
jgi:hypothetical protein